MIIERVEINIFDSQTLEAWDESYRWRLPWDQVPRRNLHQNWTKGRCGAGQDALVYSAAWDPELHPDQCGLAASTALRLNTSWENHPFKRCFFVNHHFWDTTSILSHATVSVWSVGRWGPIRTVFFRRQRHILLHQSLLHLRRRKRTWAWINTYITLFRMNIHLPPILGFWLYQDFDSHVRSWSCFKASIMGPNFKWFLESCRRWNQVCSIYGFPRFPRNLCVISGGIWCQGLGLSFCGCFWHQIRMIQRRGCAQDL